jgi:Tfp pilus assembly protein PilF
MSFRPLHVGGFAAVMALALTFIMAVPAPIPDGAAIERATGKTIEAPWQWLQRLAAQGDAQALANELPRLVRAHGDGPFAQQLRELLQNELDAPDFTRDPLPKAPVEALFAPTARDIRVDDGIDARAAAMQRRLDAGQRPGASELLALANRFRQLARPHAAWRWLARGVALHPASLPLADGLLAIQVAHGDLAGAADTAARHTGDRANDLAWQRRLAYLGAWTSRPELEAEALERLVALQPDAADQKRLIALYLHLGTPERSLRHAVALADGAAETAAAEEAAGSALREGFVDEGLAMLKRAAERAPETAPWLERFALLALQDLRLPAVTAALEAAGAADASVVDAALEDLYRRTDRPHKLADVLQRRLASQPDDARLWQELITLRAALGQREQARVLMLQRDAALADPAAFLAKLPPELRAGAGSLRARALAISLDDAADSTVVGETLEQLRPFLVQPEFRDVAESLLTKHPGDPRAKPMRRELVDIARTPREAERAAAALAATYPDDVELVQFWLQRAQWADAVEAQVAARQALAALVPGDHDNRFELAELLEFLNDRIAARHQWQQLVDAEGMTSRAVPRLIDTLFTLGDEEAAVDWLQRLAADPAATIPQRLQAADELFFRRSYDRARVLYGAVLAQAPTEPTALLRLGQIAAWTNDPRAALPFFERRLASTAAEREQVQFYLGETLWTLGEERRAKALHEEALAAFQRLPEPDFTARSCIATMLGRLGQTAAASAAYRDLVARKPRDVDLVTDYAGLSLQNGDRALARGLLAQASALAPDHARVLRLTGALAASSGDVATAESAFGRVLQQGGGDATVLSDLTQLRIDDGRITDAADAAARWLAVQPDSSAAFRADHELHEQLCDLGGLDLQWRRIGRDRTLAASLDGDWRIGEDTWLAGELAFVDQSGVTGLPSGRADSEYARLHAGIGWRAGRADRLLAGISAAPGASGDTPLGAFVAGSFQWPEPLLSLQFQGRFHDVLAEPMAAPGLGGRQSSLDVAAQCELGKGTWASAQLGCDWLSLAPDGTAKLRDERLRAEAAFGLRLIDGDVATASPLEARTASDGGISPFLIAEPAVTRRWLCNAWLAWRSAELLGDAALAGPLPLQAVSDFGVGTVRVDHHLARGFGASATCYAGWDLRSGDGVQGVEAALTWRPSFGTEFTIGGGHGASLGRSDGGDLDELRFLMVLRW